MHLFSFLFRIFTDCTCKSGEFYYMMSGTSPSDILSGTSPSDIPMVFYKLLQIYKEKSRKWSVVKLYHWMNLKRCLRNG